MFGKYNYIGLSQEMSSAVFTAPSIQLTQQSPNADEMQISGVKLRKESAYQNNVYFKDPLSNAYVNVGLSDENLSKLKEVFGENALKNEDDKILLKAKAEEIEAMKESKKLVEKELQKAGIDTSTIDLNASVEEVFENIMKQENGIEALNNIKEQVENKTIQSNVNSNSTTTKQLSLQTNKMKKFLMKWQNLPN